MREWTRWAPGTTLAVGCLLLLNVSRQSSMPLAMPLATIPSVLAGQKGFDREIDPEQQRVAGMSDYLFRAYSPNDSTADFTVYVGYYERQTQGRTIHSPKNCLPGAGWETVEGGTVTVAGREVNRALLGNSGQRALVYYWYQGRGRVASNEYGVKLDLMRDAALRGRTEESLVRIVVGLRPDLDLTRADSLAQAAAVELMPAVDRVMPEW